MRPDRRFAAISAVFVLVVLAGLGIALVTISSGQQRSQAYDMLGMQAYQAAHAGIENALHKTLRDDACPAAAPYQPAGLSAFTVKIDCTPTAISDPGAITIYQITVTACNAAVCPPATPPEGYVERQLRASVCTGADC